MRILMVGAFGSPQRDEAIARGFRECGAEVAECAYGDLLYDRHILSRIQFRFSVGPMCFNLARRVRYAAERFQPDVVFFRRPLEFTPNMIRYIRHHSRVLLASFNNDDPFSPAYRDRRWHLMRKAIPLFDVHFAFRRRNLEQYKEHGARAVSLWEPFFSPWLHRPLDNNVPQKDYKGKILFAMHAEHDGRRDAVLSLLDAGLPVRIHSWNWAKVFGERDARSLKVMQPIWEDEYVRAIGSAMATLCFFSRQNGDELTSRVFEIPAAGGLLVAERNDRIESLFRHGKEAVLFSNVDELVEQMCELSKDPIRVRKIKHKGRARLLASRHSIVDRCADALEIFQKVEEDREKMSKIQRPHYA